MSAPVTKGSNAAAAPGSGRLQQTQAQVREVVDIVRVNVDLLSERENKLYELDLKAEQLRDGAGVFKATADRVRKRYWWKNCKTTLVLAAVVAFILAIFLIWSLA